jgi:hypothetical protein
MALGRNSGIRKSLNRLTTKWHCGIAGRRLAGARATIQFWLFFFGKNPD